MDNVKVVVVGIMLLICAVEDMYYKKLHVALLAAYGVAGFVIYIMDGAMSILDFSGGMGIGFILILLSFLSRGAIGLGDGILFVITGMYLGAAVNMILLWTALVIAGLWALVSIVVLKRNKKYEIPFAPMVFLAYFIICINGAGGVGNV